MSAVMLTFDHQRTKLLAISLAQREVGGVSILRAESCCVLSPCLCTRPLSWPQIVHSICTTSFLFLSPCCLAVLASLQVQA